MSGAVREGQMEEDQRPERAAAGKREVRWSARRKEEVVMCLLRGSRSISSPGRPASRRGGSPPGARSSSPVARG